MDHQHPQRAQPRVNPTGLMRILVTGGCGFIGSHLVDRLMEQGHEVICLDNCFSGSRANIHKWLNHPNFEFVRHDVCNPIMLEVDQIYHLACPASPVFYSNNGIKTIKTNVMGTLNMLGLAKRVRARFLLTSTSEVYGDPEVHPQREDYWGHVNPIGPRSCYDEGKRTAETLAFSYHQQNGVAIRVARIFNTYGPRMLENDGRVVSNFVVQALTGQPISLYGEGTQTRSFCYVSDMVDALISLMNGDEIGPVNLGNPGEFTVKELADKILAITKSTSPYVHHALPTDDPKRRQPDITKARETLGWAPKVSLDEGLVALVDDFRARLGDRAKF
mmetsp:Transcript_14162/g.36141  ORF Transcript_14162/g.36141 Transcript_14162/m.36141 type:complete len:332 (-) Transcript_14162:192-1187(-)|eukprot:CAMPEP_0177652222 /NCGR_PEP_ID=MMETSP0447-20121125/12998_1 /TAXON_ID=0 /ORGANISM="Stygamoeba regulata, Strain BSH-02190019" /LENGTH=331 /DNA_ID=CAMNT_0019155419 /DNA_START=56 /DNA_END=1051 /DNA_ORIENTATION=-